MTSVAELKHRLLNDIVAYKPLRGEPLALRSALQDAFLLHSRSEYIEKFRLIGEGFETNARDPTKENDLSLIYTNQPLLYVDDQGKTIPASSSEPAFILHLVELLDLKPGHRVLEVGSGAGWLVALMSHVVGHDGFVTGIEINPYLHQLASRNLASHEVNNACVMHGDGNLGVPMHAPFDRIIVTAAAYELPVPIFDQLAETGQIIIPLTNRGVSEEVFLLKKVGGVLSSVTARFCKFVPLQGGDSESISGVKALSQSSVWNMVRNKNISAHHLSFGTDDPKLMPRFSYPFVSYLAKTEPNFGVYNKDSYHTANQMDEMIFGSPGSFCFGIIDQQSMSACIWQNNTVTAYGGAKSLTSFNDAFKFWDAAGRPFGLDFSLKILPSRSALPKDGEWLERRGGLDFVWHLNRHQEDR